LILFGGANASRFFGTGGSVGLPRLSGRLAARALGFAASGLRTRHAGGAAYQSTQ
jgi:hypothetical protein